MPHQECFVDRKTIWLSQIPSFPIKNLWCIYILAIIKTFCSRERLSKHCETMAKDEGGKL